MLSPPRRLARAPRSSHQLVTWRSAAALTPPPPRARRPRPQSAGATRRLPPARPDDAPASCGVPTQQVPPRTPRWSPPDEPGRGWTRPVGRPAPPGMFCTPRGSFSASSLLTARRVGQRELSARAAAAEAAEEEACWPQYVRSPDAASNPPGVARAAALCTQPAINQSVVLEPAITHPQPATPCAQPATPRITGALAGCAAPARSFARRAGSARNVRCWRAGHRRAWQALPRAG